MPRRPRLAVPILHSLLAEDDVESKLFAMDRLGLVRSIESVPLLVDYLGAGARLSSRAHETLVAIAGKDLGNEPQKWLGWFEENDESCK